MQTVPYRLCRDCGTRCFPEVALQHCRIGKSVPGCRRYQVSVLSSGCGPVSAPCVTPVHTTCLLVACLHALERSSSNEHNQPSSSLNIQTRSLDVCTVYGYSNSQCDIASPLQEHACYVKSRSVTCHPAEVTFPPLLPAEAVTRFSAPDECKAELAYTLQ